MMITPVDVPIWVGEISQTLTPRLRSISYQEQENQSSSGIGLLQVVQSNVVNLKNIYLGEALNKLSIHTYRYTYSCMSM